MSELIDIKAIFSPIGQLAQAFDGYVERKAQVDMADAVDQAIEDDASICIEAGTGTGKTFAYLVPALKQWHNSDKTIVISTGTKNLQDQLFFRDLPSVCEALGVSPKLALLKGRSNYLCEYRMEQSLESGRFQSRSMADNLVKIQEWATRSKSGDLTQCEHLGDNDPLWSYVSSTNENCLGTDCPIYDDCAVVKARSKAMGADVVVVNHHLLLADMVLKDDGFGELLPEVDMVIIDEAHQLADIAHTFFGHRFASRQVMELCRDTELEAMTTAKDDRQLSVAVRRVEGAINELRMDMGDSGKKVNWQLVSSPKLTEKLDNLKAELSKLKGRLDQHAVRSKGLESCHKRATESLSALSLLTDNEQVTQAVRWIETYRQGFAIQETPLDIAESFNACRNEQSASSWVFTSATITQANDFSHFKNQLGLHEAREMVLDSPFDYANQAILHVPRNLPDPRDKHYIKTWQAEVLPIVKANPGGTFVLFTSYYAMNQVHDFWEDEFPDNLLLKQGEKPKTELIDEFRNRENAVLLATSSFWEGVDVKGLALSCVIIDKLPFAAPDEPLIEAKIKALRSNGGNPFFDLQIPEAIISLKQGAGRLIRDQEDRGVLVLCDPRLIATNYGKRFLQSLPDMKRTRDREAVIEFVNTLSDES